MEFSGLLWFLLWIFRAGVCVLRGYHQPPGGATTSVMFNLLQVDILVFPFPAHCLCDGLVMLIPRSVWCFSLRNIEEVICFLTLCVKRRRAYAISVDHSVPLLFAVTGSSRPFLTCWQVPEERPSLPDGLLECPSASESWLEVVSPSPGIWPSERQALPVTKISHVHMQEGVKLGHFRVVRAFPGLCPASPGSYLIHWNRACLLSPLPFARQDEDSRSRGLWLAI